MIDDLVNSIKPNEEKNDESYEIFSSIEDDLKEDRSWVMITRSKDMIDKYGLETVGKYVDDLIERMHEGDKKITGNLVSKAFSLVNPEELNSKSQEYLKEVGLVELPQRIVVMPGLKDSNINICNDIGYWFFESYDSLYKYDSGIISFTDLLNEIRKHKLNAFDSSEKNTRGSWVTISSEEIPPMRKFSLTVSGCFIHGKIEGSRGIIVPSWLSRSTAYAHSPVKSPKKTSIFVPTTSIDQDSATALSIISFLLVRPEVPSKLAFVINNPKKE